MTGGTPEMPDGATCDEPVTVPDSRHPPHAPGTRTQPSLCWVLDTHSALKRKNGSHLHTHREARIPRFP